MSSSDMSVVSSNRKTIKNAFYLKQAQVASFYILFDAKRKKTLTFLIKILCHCLNMIPINQRCGFPSFLHKKVLFFHDKTKNEYKT